jgi:hypothetical protein
MTIPLSVLETPQISGWQEIADLKAIILNLGWQIFSKQIENDACDVTLSVYPHRASLKNMPVHGGNRTYDLWNTSPMDIHSE